MWSKNCTLQLGTGALLLLFLIFSRLGSLMTGLYENTAYFRIGDVNLFSERLTEGEPTRKIVGTVDVYKIVIRGGGLDYEDPGTAIARYPADYAFRLIDVVVKK